MVEEARRRRLETSLSMVEEARRRRLETMVRVCAVVRGGFETGSFLALLNHRICWSFLALLNHRMCGWFLALLNHRDRPR